MPEIHNLAGNCLELEFYYQVADNIIKSFNNFDIVFTADGPGDSFKPLVRTKLPKLVFHFSDELNNKPTWIDNIDVFLLFKNYAPLAIHPKIIPIPLPPIRGFCGGGSKLIKDRPIDVFFSGQTNNPPRKVMLSELEAFKQNNPQYNLLLRDSGGFSLGYDIKEFSSILSNTKIAICPAGNNSETFRWTEATKCGCSIIGNPKPNYWYYQETPHILVRHWSEIHQILPKLLTSYSLMEDFRVKNIKHFNDKLSVEAVSNKLIAEIQLRLK